MPAQIALIVKHFPNGRFEVAEAWFDQAKAEERVPELIEPGAYYTLSVWNTELKDTVEVGEIIKHDVPAAS